VGRAWSAAAADPFGGGACVGGVVSLYEPVILPGYSQLKGGDFFVKRQMGGAGFFANRLMRAHRGAGIGLKGKGWRLDPCGGEGGIL
jgi:hypothetical protein